MNCRFGLKHSNDKLASELPPGLTEIPCTVTVVREGEFSAQLHLFIDDGGTREIVFTVGGHASADDGSAKTGQ